GPALRYGERLVVIVATVIAGGHDSSPLSPSVRSRYGELGMHRRHVALRGIGDRLERDLRHAGLHRPEDRGEGHVRRVATRADADEPGDRRNAGWIEQVPVPAEHHLDVRVEIGRSKRRIGAVVYAGDEPRWVVERAAIRDHG